MTLAAPIEIHARFENGVFVPEGKVELAEHQRVTLRISPNALPRYDDPNDPRPAGGVELADWWARHRLEVTPDIAKIATDPEFDIENS
jgi:AF2212-like